MEMPNIHRTSFRRASQGNDGDANKLFFTYFISVDIGINLLKDVELIRSKVTCNICGRDMTWCAGPKPHGFIGRCRRQVVAVCSELKSIKHGSCFQHTNLTFQQSVFHTNRAPQT